MSTPDVKKTVSLAGHRAEAGAHAIQQEHTGISPLVTEAVTEADDPYPPSPLTVIALLAAILVLILAAFGLDRLLGDTAENESTVRGILIAVRGLTVIAFAACALELALMLLRKLGVPALTLDQVRHKFNEEKAQAKRRAQSGGRWVGQVIGQLAINPQFVLTTLIAAGTVATGIVATTPPTATGDPQMERLTAAAITTLKSDISLLTSTLASNDAALARQIADVNVAVTDLRLQLPEVLQSEPVNQQLVQLNSALNSLTEQDANLAATVGHFSRDESTLARNRKVLEQLNSITTTVGTVSTSIAGLKTTVDQTRSLVDETKTAVRAAQDHIDARLKMPYSNDSVAQGVDRLIKHESAIDHHVWRFLTREQLFSILDEPYSPSADQ